MKPSQLLENPLNRDVVSLLAACNIPALEKRVWIDLLPDMTDEEKEDLKENLTEEAEYETRITVEAAEKFIAGLEQFI
ncbi:hypothetical protein HZA42_00375 [Candidatus Peregrinibacteria bacterium]|nr:hypothetical protein [Candidatus Peregrinibacteria bacterium]